MLMLCFVWLVSLQLTKQRIVLEAENKLNSLQLMQSPFVWDFNHFHQDIVESFQPYWQTGLSGVIQAKQARNPQLSLNFSGQSFYTQLHDKLIIHSPKELYGEVKIQAKANLDDADFYYSTTYKLSGHSVELNLTQPWKVIKSSGEVLDSVNWGEELAKVSSLVLIF